MELLEWSDILKPSQIGKTLVSLTIGAFDGLHLGHQTLIETTRIQGQAPVLAVTFRKNPKKFFGGAHYEGDLLTVEQKINLFRALGVDKLLLIDFSEEFSKMTGSVFYAHLEQHFKIKGVFVGYDFSFGHRSATKASDLEAIMAPHTNLTILPPVQVGKGPVSSSRIRSAIKAGNLAEAESMLGRQYEVFVPWAKGKSAGQQIRISKSDFSQVLPTSGLFSATAGSAEENIEMTSEDVVFPGHHFGGIPYITIRTPKGDKNGFIERRKSSNH